MIFRQAVAWTCVSLSVHRCIRVLKMSRRHPTCQYPTERLTDEDALVRLIGRIQVREQLDAKIVRGHQPRPVTFTRLRLSKEFRDAGEVYLETLLAKLLQEGRIHVTDGRYYLPPSILRQIGV